MSRKTEDLYPFVRGRCEALVNLAKEKIGRDIMVVETLRSDAGQFAYLAQGRQTLQGVNSIRKAAGLPPITDAQNKIITKAGTSIHQFGLAFDVCFLKDGKPDWSIKSDLNENHIPDYEELGKLGESLGLTWGGRFSFRDYVHFEDRGGLTLAELKAGKRPTPGPSREGNKC